MIRPSARDVVAAVRSGASSTEAVAEAAIGRIAASTLGAVVDFHAEEGRAAARAVDRRLAAGEDLPLAGLPVLIKDTIWVAGRRVTNGSLLFADFVPPVDAIVVERLRRAGAVVMGMANTSEFACKGVTTNRVYGPTRHPLDPTLTPGGSSGGPAAAVAAGLVPVAIGTDAGGSSRRPPAHCGIVGFKPSFGAIPNGPGFPGPFSGIECLAPIGRDVGDVRLVFEALVGPDPRDPESAAIAPPEPPPGRAPRIAFSPRLGLDVPVDADVVTALERVRDLLIGAGLDVVTRDPIWPDGVGETALMPLQHAGLAALYGARYRDAPDLFDPDVGRQIERGLALDGAAVARARLTSEAVARSLAGFLATVDLLIGPTVPCPPWPLDRLGPETIDGVAVDPRAHAVFTPLFNHAFVPALTLPCGQTRNGLPIGLQIVAARGRDRNVLDAAQTIEALLSEPRP